MSSASIGSVAPPLLGDLFISPSLTAGGPSRADDANGFALLHIHYCKQTPVLRKPQQDEPLFLRRMTRIGHNATERIAEDRRRLLERDFVFGQICRSLLGVSLELQ